VEQPKFEGHVMANERESWINIKNLSG